MSQNDRNGGGIFFGGILLGASLATVAYLMMDRQKREEVISKVKQLKDRLDQLSGEIHRRGERAVETGKEAVKEIVNDLEKPAPKTERKQTRG